MARIWFILTLLMVTPGMRVAGQTEFPYRLDSVTETMLVVGGSVLMFDGAYGQNEKRALPEIEIAKLDAMNVGRFDRFATKFWDPQLNRIREKFEPGTSLLVIAGIGVYGLNYKTRNHDWEALKTLSLMYLEGLYLCSGTMAISKALVNKPRPYAYNKELPLYQRYRQGNNESFFSGNANILFYNAVFFSKVFGDLYPESRLKPWIWATALGIAGFNGYLTVRSGMHFPTDVITGALVAGIAGYAVPMLHNKRFQERLQMSPWASEKAGGISLRWVFR